MKLLLLLFSVSTFAAIAPNEPDTISQLAYSNYWLRLLHYHPTLFSKLGTSSVDGDEFFFAENGKENPEAEMRATIQAFSQNIEVGKMKQHPQCAFPERYRYLKSELKLMIADVPCPKLEAYYKKIRPHSVALVFSSAYPNNPSSMFGHTLLRINAEHTNKGNQNKLDLLDWGISYAAQVPHDENGFAFIYFGVTGGYPGQFTLLPYYAKVNEYNHAESRDIWEYELNINAEETKRMIAHIWEIETNTYLDYYFFDENCALILLEMLEVAKPDWQLTSTRPLYVIPGDTVKQVAKIPGAVREVNFRPSLRKRTLQRYAALSKDSKTLFWEIIEGDKAPLTIEDSFLLDTASHYLSYLKQKEGNDLSSEKKEILRKTLLQRSTLASAETSLIDLPPIDHSNRPDLGHDTFRVGSVSGIETRGTNTRSTRYFQDILFKFPYHDLLNWDLGYLPFSQIDFPGVTLRYVPQDTKLYVEEIQGIAITSLFPMTFIEMKPSWAFKVDYRTPKDLDCSDCQLAHIDAGIGASLGIVPEKAIVYFLGYGQFELGNAVQKGYRVLPKLQVAFIASPFDRYKFQMASHAVFDLFQDERQGQFYQLEFNQSYAFDKNWETRLMLSSILPSSGYENRTYLEGKLAVHYYW